MKSGGHILWYNTPINAEIIKFIQSFSSPFLDYLFQFITMLGEETFFMLAIPIIYWCIDKKFAFRLGLASLSSTVVNCGIKEALRVPRPIGEPGIRSLRIETATGYSFPSGHTQSATTFWMVLMLHNKKKWVNIFGTMLIILVGLSRLYLGVHRPVDVAAALAIGFIWVLISNFLFDAAERTGRKSLFLIFIIPMFIFLLISPDADYCKAFAVTLAFYAGYIMEPKYIKFNVEGEIKQQVLKVVIGLAVMFAIRVLLKQLLPLSLTSDFIRYFLIGIWATLGAPYLFKKFFTPHKTGRDTFFRGQA